MREQKCRKRDVCKGECDAALENEADEHFETENTCASLTFRARGTAATRDYDGDAGTAARIVEARNKRG
jgi:hypothetical protein